MKHVDAAAIIIFWGTLLLFLGIIGRGIAKRLNQPGVLGELFMGIIVGNICYYFGMQSAIVLRDSANVFHIIEQLLAGTSIQTAVNLVFTESRCAAQILSLLQGPSGSEWVKLAYVIDAFSRYGAIFLLFMVGLDSSIKELKHTGQAAFKVAIIGVIAPIIIGLFITHLLLPSSAFNTHLFIATTLSATSVGITAQVLREMKRLNTREARTILGAAMIDDILGLIILALVSSLVVSGDIKLSFITRTVLSAGLFFVGAFTFGPWVLKKSIRRFNFLEPWEAKLYIAFLFTMCLAWIATVVQLAAIIGAFVAGVIIHDGFFKSREQDNKNPLSIKNVMAPFEFIFAPLFFMLIGIQVKLELFLNKHVLLLGVGLIFAALLGKLISGLGGSRRDDRFLIGIGMVPRGEVGLVFASIGKSLNVISDQVFSAIILMVTITTLITPWWLKKRFEKRIHVEKI